jgi:hypothetical protein
MVQSSKKISKASISLFFKVLFFITTAISLVHAGEIKKIQGKEGDDDIILITGEIDRETERKFRAMALETDDATVVLSGPGGMIRPAIEIGRIIRIKGYTTAVLDSGCVSSCALIWLAGQARMTMPKARVGFHSAYIEHEDGRKVSASVGNALVGAYLNSLGMNERIVEFVTTAPPESIRWLSKQQADQLGLFVTILDDKRKARANFNLAIQNRWGPNPSLPEVVRLYRESAADGFSGAQNNLGDLYESGEGVRRNDKFAMYLYTRAAERGEPTAYLSLATFLIEGADDVAIFIEALKFALLAERYLPDGQNKKTATTAIRHIAVRLSAEQRKKAAELASSWRPLYQERYLMSDTPSSK